MHVTSDGGATGTAVETTETTESGGERVDVAETNSADGTQAPDLGPYWRC